jgi:hypothetical protein
MPEGLDVQQSGQTVPEQSTGDIASQLNNTGNPSALKPEGNANEHLTQAQLDAWWAEQRKSVLNEAYRNNQSNNDKYQARVEKAVKQLEAAGFKTPNRQDVERFVQSQQREEEEQQSKAQSSQSIDPSMQEFAQRFNSNRVEDYYYDLKNMEDQAGVKLEPNDEEFKNAFGNLKSKMTKYQFVVAYGKALQEKASRVNSNQQQPPNRAGVPSASGVSGKQSRSFDNKAKSFDIQSSALEELRKGWGS